MIGLVWAWLADPAHWSGPGGIPTRVGEHLLYTALALVLGALIAWPLGAWVGHTGRARWLVSSANAARAVPSLGLLFGATLFLSPYLRGESAFLLPSLIVLVLLAVPPLLSGAYAGIEAVDPAARDAAKGMGMTQWQVLSKVELPCALPLVLSGARSATLQVIGTATIAAYVSLGGLGAYLSEGLAIGDYPMVAGGAILVALLALAADALLALASRYAVSPGLRSQRRPRRQDSAATATAPPALSGQVDAADTLDPHTARPTNPDLVPGRPRVPD